jgi:hypothetical protein
VHFRKNQFLQDTPKHEHFNLKCWYFLIIYEDNGSTRFTTNLYLKSIMFNNVYIAISHFDPSNGLRTTMKCPYLIFRHKPRSGNENKCVITNVHCIPTLEELSKYCDVEGESAFLTCLRFLRKLRSK